MAGPYNATVQIVMLNGANNAYNANTVVSHRQRRLNAGVHIVILFKSLDKQWMDEDDVYNFHSELTGTEVAKQPAVYCSLPSHKFA